MPVANMRQLLEAGIHFGHQTRRWNPKMRKFIFGERNGIYILDLQKTLRQLCKGYALVRDTVAAGGSVLFVGTKKQAQEPIKRAAEQCGMYYINTRWLGGTLTNFQTVQRSIRRLIDLEQRDANGKLDQLSKKEASRLRKQMVRLQANLNGIKSMDKLPDLVFVIDTKKEAIAVREAERLHIPCIGVVDTNGDPDCVPLPIPGNDDAIRAVGLFCNTIASAIMEGAAQGEKQGGSSVRPMRRNRPETYAEAALAAEVTAARPAAADAVDEESMEVVSAVEPEAEVLDQSALEEAVLPETVMADEDKGEE